MLQSYSHFFLSSQDIKTLCSENLHTTSDTRSSIGYPPNTSQIHIKQECCYHTRRGGGVQKYFFNIYIHVGEGQKLIFYIHTRRGGGVKTFYTLCTYYSAKPRGVCSNIQGVCSNIQLCSNIPFYVRTYANYVRTYFLLRRETPPGKLCMFEHTPKN